MSALLNAIKNETNETLTENGAVSLKSTMKSTVDFFGFGGALRTRSEDDVIKIFSKAFHEDELVALRTLFYLRDIRGGQGERKTFRTILAWLGEYHPEHVIANLHNIVVFGRWDDLFALRKTNLWNTNVLPIIKEIWNAETSGGKASLFWKWMPSNNTSSKDARNLANEITKYLEISPKQYRKTLVEMRKKLSVVETQMCAKDWVKIDYSHVPSRASLIYRKAFARHDTTRYQQYLEDVASGKTKINAGVLYPYDIVGKCLNGEKEATLDVLWNALPNYVEGDTSNSIVVADVSGSMTGRPMAVSISLALYISERNKGLFKDHFITFSTNPTLEKVVGKNIVTKVANLEKANWSMSTNLEGVFDLILNTAVKNNLAPSDMPATIYIVSDMEFDQACERPDKSLFENIKTKYHNANYEIPKLVFWNVNARNTHVPIKHNDRGVCLVSGCSPSILKTVINNGVLNAEQVMLDTINTERYSVIVLP